MENIFIDQETEKSSLGTHENFRCDHHEEVLGERPIIRLFKQADVSEFMQRAQLSKDSGDVASARQVAKTMRIGGVTRQLTTLNASYREGLDILAENFPNFVEVIDYLRCCAELAWRTDKILKFTPILMNGPAGVGKTKFSEAVAEWIMLDFHRICISSSQDGSELSGSSAFFSNSKPGIPFLKLLNSKHANHLFFIDEIDKNSTKSYDALGGLYTLLEPTSATTFKDLAFPIEIDASHLLWLAACNDIDNVPEAIASRFTVFDIGITVEQSRKITEFIVSECLAKYHPATEGMTFSENALTALSHVTPRKTRQAVTEAIGRAMVEGISKIDRVRIAAKQTFRLGFLS